MTEPSIEELWTAFDAAAKSKFGMSGQDFARVWDVGGFDHGEYGIDVAMLRPARNPYSSQ